MAPKAIWLRGCALALLGLWLAMGAACSSQQEVKLSALHYFERGNKAFQAEDYRRAIRHYRTALEFDDQSPDIYYNLGLAYYRVGAYKDAVAADQHAVKLDPTFADAHLNMALAYDKLYNATAADLHYNRYRSLMTGKKEVDAIPAGDVPMDTSDQPVGGFQSVSTLSGVAGQGGASGGAGSVTGQGLPEGATAGGIKLPPQGGRPGTIPPASSLRQAEQPQPRNPFKGNAKWWTQDAAIQSQ